MEGQEILIFFLLNGKIKKHDNLTGFFIFVSVKSNNNMLVDQSCKKNKFVKSNKKFHIISYGCQMNLLIQRLLHQY